ncbi:7057_t:CDS:2, partial [Cetraspora pellucida]
EIKELKSKNTNLTEYKAKYYSKLKEANSFQSRIKSLEEELSLTQKYLSKKDSEIMSLKAELVNIKIELDSNVSELERLKLEDISISVIGGDSEKNISKSRPEGSLLCNNNISAVSETSKNLSQYFAHRKIMNEVEKISTDIPTHTNNKIVPILESSKIDTEITSKIKNVTPIRSHNITIGRSKELLIIALGAKVMDSQSVMQKNSKTRLPPMKLFLMDMDETTKHASSYYIGHPAMSWPFAKLVTEKSGTGKTNIFGNLVLGNKAEYIYKKKKDGSRYIQCDDLIVCGYHPEEPKWAFVRYMYGIIASNPRASYYENIRFSYISPEKIPSVKSFSPKRSTNILPIFIMQKYHHVPMIIHENLSHILMFNSSSSSQDVSKIVGRYTDDVKSASMVINSYLRKSEFIVFDLNRAEDDPLAIQLRFDTPLDLQKEIELHQKRKTKNALPTELTNSEPEKLAT